MLHNFLKASTISPKSSKVGPKPVFQVDSRDSIGTDTIYTHCIVRETTDDEPEEMMIKRIPSVDSIIAPTGETEDTR